LSYSCEEDSAAMCGQYFKLHNELLNMYAMIFYYISLAFCGFQKL